MSEPSSNPRELDALRALLQQCAGALEESAKRARCRCSYPGFGTPGIECPMCSKLPPMRPLLAALAAIKAAGIEQDVK